MVVNRFNEEMIESLFGYAPPDRNKNQPKGSASQDPSNQYIQIIDPKKSQNLAILLKALNVTTEEVCDALQEGDLFSLSLSLLFYSSTLHSRAFIVCWTVGEPRQCLVPFARKGMSKMIFWACCIVVTHLMSLAIKLKKIFNMKKVSLLASLSIPSRQISQVSLQ